MTRDKQLLNVSLEEVIEKRRLDQALNAKEFAVLAGVSYSAARAWFRQPDFPAISGVVFWQDFVEWRKAKRGLQSGEIDGRETNLEQVIPAKSKAKFTGRAAQILAEAR